MVSHDQIRSIRSNVLHSDGTIKVVMKTEWRVYLAKSTLKYHRSSVPRQGQGMAEEPLEKATSGQQHPRTSSMVHQWHRRLLIHLTLVLFFHYSVLLLLDFCWNSPLTTHTSTPSQTVDSTVRGPCWQLDSAQAEDDLLPAISARGVLLSGQSS